MVVLVSGQEVLEEVLAMTECLENIDRYSCQSSSYSSDVYETGPYS